MKRSLLGLALLFSGGQNAWAQDLPQTAELQYSVTYGGLPAGSATLSWQQQQANYQIHMQLKPVIGPRLQYVSRGKLTAQGLQPLEFYAERSGKTRERAQFDWVKQTLQFGKDFDKTETLQAQAQDVLSVTFQLAHWAKNQQTLQVSTGKKTYLNQVQSKAPSVFVLGSQKIAVKVLASRDPDGDFTEFWFAPDWQQLPLRIVRSDEGKLIDQRLTSLKINGQQRLP